jgi:hypothetical protein
MLSMEDDLEKRLQNVEQKERENLALQVFKAGASGMKIAAKNLYERTVLRYEGDSQKTKGHALHSAVGLGVGVGLTALTGFGIIPLVALGYGALRLYHTGKDVQQSYKEWKEEKRLLPYRDDLPDD